MHLFKFFSISSVLGALLMSSSLAFGVPSQGKEFGLGFVLGGPSAISAKWFHSKEVAYDLQVSFDRDDYVAVWGDYLFHRQGVLGRTDGYLSQFGSYVGVGPVIAIATKDDHNRGRYFDKRDDDFAAGVRVPFGLEWFWQRAPLAVGLELAPGMMVVPATTGFIEGALTLRFYF